jgi:ABC-type lipoprotein release transport system permease subunit
VSILGRKRWRDLRRQKAQVAAVALTIGLGLAGFVAARDAYLDLRGSLDNVYSQLRFADLTVTGGDPATITAGVGQLPGQPLAVSRVQADVPLGIGSSKLLARLISLPADGSQPPVDLLDVQLGQLDADGVAVEHHLAAHFGLKPGDTLTLAAANGWRVYRVSAVVTSPEYLWPARSPQEIMTDPSQFGVLFAAEPLVRALARASAVPQVALYAQDRTRAEALVRDGRVLAALAGATEITDRTQQASARALDDDVNAMAEYAVLFPLLFLSGAILGAYILLSRLVAAQRVVIGTLRASGVPAGRLRRHYLGYGLAAGAAGSVLGVALGVPLGIFFAGSYAEAIGLPFHVTDVHPATIGSALLVGLSAAAAAAWLPARAAARLHPGEAMRVAPATGGGRRSIAERLIPQSRRHTRWTMVLRGPGRNRRRTVLTVAGVILALSLVIVPVGLWDTLHGQMARQFTTVQREDLQLYARPGGTPALLAAARADPQVAAAEPFARSDVTISAAGRTHTTLLFAYQPGTAMHGFPGALPVRGVLLPVTLRDSMHLRVGDEVALALPSAGTRTSSVTGFVDEPMGALAYTTLAQYADWTGTTTPDAAAGAVAVRLLDGADRAEFVARYAGRPEVTAALDVRALQRSMTDAFSLYDTLVVLMGLIGAAMAGALLYTTASANITERYVELGSLRAAGMGAGMLGRLAAAENLLLAASATVPGVIAGWLLARAFTAAYNNDQMRMTLNLRPLTLPAVAALVLIVAAVAQLPALRGIRRTDIARVVRERSV